MTCNATQEFEKDPNAVLDYVWDWGLWLGTDVITNATLLPADGITVQSSTFTTTAVTGWIAGGTAGDNYEVTCRISTLGGRTADWSFVFKVREK